MIAEAPSVESIRYVNEKSGSCVEYDREHGVTCPVCGVNHPCKGAGVHTTKPWIGGTRARYHTCPLCHSGFRSQEEN
jgi:formate dehydrogenase maturation protein FdhE